MTFLNSFFNFSRLEKARASRYKTKDYLQNHPSKAEQPEMPSSVRK